ncbi:glycosyltransferase [Mangrovimonas sp. AS39]|uniref:glycosyltransferase n=1 Tax=Mangrovimonas futianensis TaxID=2895523 RepID=UPI001E54192A|nr:glycosyltransferase [Mangrovimonas futianensis]MCF1191240.1 glycosyltransferase [Mangrovimonas futianensis]MCF1194935.1 glycosyltransferase [Mangrovimonas futianensis]
MNIAILSPNRGAYTETFIQAQKNGLKGKVFFYYDGFIPKMLEGHGSIQIKFGTIKKKIGLVFQDVASESLYQSLKSKKIEVVLAQYGPTGEAVALICDKLNIPLVVHFHGYDASMQSVINKCNRYKKAFKIANAVIAVSNEMEKDLIALGCPPQKIVYNPCVSADNFFSIEPKFQKPQFVGVGRFTDKKAPYYSILAFSKVLKQFPKATLVMAGEGELLEVCKNLVVYLGIKHAVKFPGIITTTEFMMLLEESLAFVQHSITASNGDKEGTPVAVQEASAAGLPIVATKHAGISDVVKHGETGFLADEHDVEAFSRYMLKVIKEFDLAKSLGAQGKQMVKKNFNMEKHLSVLNGILHASIK